MTSIRKNLTLMSLLFVLPFVLSGCSYMKRGVLNPQGPVAQKQYDLIVWSSILMSLVLIAVSVLFVYMLIKYREKPGENREIPDEEGSKWLEIIWTGIPVIIVLALAIPTVKQTFELERSPSPNTKPMTIHVTSANWKWIFHYPEQGISTVNYVKIPANVPIQFKLDAVGPMNSFWVPELGGQEYTMPGMSMKLWLEADRPGTYLGRSANYSGEHFTHMEFEVISEEQSKFDQWVSQVKQNAPKQTEADYKKLLEPGLSPERTYSSYPKNVAELNGPSGSHHSTDHQKQQPKQSENNDSHQHHSH